MDNFPLMGKILDPNVCTKSYSLWAKHSTVSNGLYIHIHVYMYKLSTSVALNMNIYLLAVNNIGSHCQQLSNTCVTEPSCSKQHTNYMYIFSSHNCSVLPGTT